MIFFECPIRLHTHDQKACLISNHRLLLSIFRLSFFPSAIWSRGELNPRPQIDLSVELYVRSRGSNIYLLQLAHDGPLQVSLSYPPKQRQRRRC